MWSWATFLTGLFLGMLAMLIVGWVAFQTRTFVFTYCPAQVPACGLQDYFNDPGQYLASGGSLQDLLFLDRGALRFRRPTTSSQCSPESPTVTIDNPQFCNFLRPDGTPVEGKSVSFNAPDYIYTLDGSNYRHIETLGNCTPGPGSPFLSGSPSLKWERDRLRLPASQTS